MTFGTEFVPVEIGTVGGAVKVAPLSEFDVTETGEMDPHWTPGPGAAPHGIAVPSDSLRLGVNPIESFVGFPLLSYEVAVTVWLVLMSMVVAEGVTTRVFAFGFLGMVSQFEAKTTSDSVNNSRNELRFIA
jgi:hypothetical protein